MSKHAKPETPLERADRLINELRDDHIPEASHHPSNTLYCHRVHLNPNGETERVMALGGPSK